MSNIKLFESKKIRSQWDEEQEKWYFSIVDVIAVLTDSPNPNNYWKVLKHRLAKEGNQSVTNCNQLKMESSGGGNTRKAIEAKTGKKIVTKVNAKKLIESKRGKK